MAWLSRVGFLDGVEALRFSCLVAVSCFCECSGFDSCCFGECSGFVSLFLVGGLAQPSGIPGRRREFTLHLSCCGLLVCILVLSGIALLCFVGRLAQPSGIPRRRRELGTLRRARAPRRRRRRGRRRLGPCVAVGRGRLGRGGAAA